jgi:hypothetical protein
VFENKVLKSVGYIWTKDGRSERRLEKFAQLFTKFIIRHIITVTKRRGMYNPWDRRKIDTKYFGRKSEGKGQLGRPTR